MRTVLKLPLLTQITRKLCRILPVILSLFKWPWFILTFFLFIAQHSTNEHKRHEYNKTTSLLTVKTSLILTIGMFCLERSSKFETKPVMLVNLFRPCTLSKFYDDFFVCDYAPTFSSIIEKNENSWTLSQEEVKEFVLFLLSWTCFTNWPLIRSLVPQESFKRNKALKLNLVGLKYPRLKT